MTGYPDTEAAPDPAYPAHPAGTYGEAASYPNGSTYSGAPQPTAPTFTPTFTYPGEQSHAGEQPYSAGGYPAGYPEEPQAAGYPAAPTFTPLSQAEQAQRGYWSGDPPSGDPQAGRDSREQGYARRR